MEYFQDARRNDRPYGIFGTITRISAPEIEQTVTAAAVTMLADESAVTLALEKSGTNSDRLSCALKSSQSWLERLQSANESVSALVELVTRVDISRMVCGFCSSCRFRPPKQMKNAEIGFLSAGCFRWR